MFLVTEQAIASHLEQALPAGVRVFKAAELSGISDKAQFTPAVHVIFGGYSPTQETAAGAIQEVETRWYIVVAVRHARGNAATHEDADPLLDTVFHTLGGWRPSRGMTPLKLADGPRPLYESGFAYYPLVFTTRQTLRSGAA